MSSKPLISKDTGSKLILAHLQDVSSGGKRYYDPTIPISSMKSPREIEQNKIRNLVVIILTAVIIIAILIVSWHNYGT